MRGKGFVLAAVAAIVLGVVPTAAEAATEIQWWHAMGGALGERVNEIADNFNESQSEYRLIASYKGSYAETMTAGIAAFRAGKQPHIMQVFGGSSGSSPAFWKASLLKYRTGVELLNGIDSILPSVVV
jgi:sn-glycerol 3-phosphate transport system substrate-binding protein